MSENKDEALKGNEQIEQYIEMLQKEPSQEMLAVVLTSIRRQMNAGAQVVVAVNPSLTNNFEIQAMELENGEKWIPAYTSFEEEMKGGQEVMSTFLADMGQLFDMALEEKSVKGVILNPWNRTIMLEKDLIRLIKGEIKN